MEVAKILPFLLLCAFLLFGYLLSRKQTKLDDLQEQLSKSNSEVNDLKEIVDATTTSLETLRIQYEERITSSRMLEGEIHKLRSQIQTFEKLTAKLKDSSEILELDLAKSVDESVKKQSGKITVYELFSLLKRQKMDVIHSDSARKKSEEEVKALKEEVREKAHELEILSIKSEKLNTTLNKYISEKNAFLTLREREAALSRREKHIERELQAALDHELAKIIKAARLDRNKNSISDILLGLEELYLNLEKSRALNAEKLKQKSKNRLLGYNDSVSDRQKLKEKSATH